MYTVYVLYSPGFDKIYIGQTENLDHRLNQHNNGNFRSWTKACRPWEVIHCETFENRALGKKRERQLKSYRGRMLLQLEISYLTES